MRRIADDAAQLAGSRSSGRAPDEDGATEREFTQDLREWMLRLGDTLVCAVAESTSGLVGMGWLVVFERARTSTTGTG